MSEVLSTSTNKHTVIYEKTVTFVGNTVEASNIKSDRPVLSFHCGSSLRTMPVWCFATSGSGSVAKGLDEGVPTH
jgi:hypothetical protein